MEYKIDIRLVEGNEHLKAYANVLMDNQFLVKGITLVDGEKGMFLNMPSKKGNDEKYYNQFYPVTKDAREELTNAVIDEYRYRISKTQTVESATKTKKQAPKAGEQEQESKETSADTPKPAKGHKQKEPEPEPDEEQGMAMGM